LNKSAFGYIFILILMLPGKRMVFLYDLHIVVK
jgi:hypothetical protein